MSGTIKKLQFWGISILFLDSHLGHINSSVVLYQPSHLKETRITSKLVFFNTSYRISNVQKFRMKLDIIRSYLPLLGKLDFLPTLATRKLLG